MILKYVRKKSEITEYMLSYSEMGQQVYRTRMTCECELNNRRSGILVIDTVTLKLEAKVMRCKGCNNLQKGGNV